MELQVAQLLLDTVNPRTGASESQRAAINALITDGPSQMLALADDILTQQILNPAESPIVVEEDGHHVVIEGNRRLACLKLLRNPELAENPRIVSQFRALAQRGTGPDSIDAWVAESREDAAHWIRLRHTGENAGVGVRAWNPEQQVRFTRQKNTQAGRALVFADELNIAFADDKEMLSALLAARQRALTTLGRLVSDPDVRRAFGFDIRGDELVFHHNRRATRAALLRLLHDVGSNSVAMFMTKKDRSKYVQDSKAHLPGADSLLSAPARSDELPPADDAEPAADEGTDGPDTGGSGDGGGAGSQDGATSDEGTNERGPSRPTRQDRVIYEGLRLKHVAVRSKKTLKEAQLVTIEDAPHVCAVMLRVVLELVLTEAGLRYKWFAESEHLDKKVVAAVRRLDPDYQNSQANPDLKNAYNASARDRGGVGIVDLHAAVHSIDRVASTSDVRARSADFRPLLVAIDHLLGQNP